MVTTLFTSSIFFGLGLMVWSLYKSKYGSGPPDHRQVYIWPFVLGLLITCVAVPATIIYVMKM